MQQGQQGRQVHLHFTVGIGPQEGHGREVAVAFCDPDHQGRAQRRHASPGSFERINDVGEAIQQCLPDAGVEQSAHQHQGQGDGLVEKFSHFHRVLVAEPEQVGQEALSLAFLGQEFHVGHGDGAAEGPTHQHDVLCCQHGRC